MRWTKRWLKTKSTTSPTVENGDSDRSPVLLDSERRKFLDANLRAHAHQWTMTTSKPPSAPHPNPERLEQAWEDEGILKEAGDIGGDGGGQKTEVGHPYDGEGGVVRGTEKQSRDDEGEG